MTDLKNMYCLVLRREGGDGVGIVLRGDSPTKILKRALRLTERKKLRVPKPKKVKPPKPPKWTDKADPTIKRLYGKSHFTSAGIANIITSEIGTLVTKNMVVSRANTLGLSRKKNAVHRKLPEA
jgi:hypothetical protein